MRREFTLVEMMMVVAIIGLLGAIAIPAFAEYQTRAKRAELPLNLSAIGDATRAYLETHDALSTCTHWVPQTPPGKTKRPFLGTYASCFTDLGWEPDGEVYANYATVGAGLLITGLEAGCGCNGDPACAYALEDVDGDAETAAWQLRMGTGIAECDNSPTGAAE